MPTYLEQLPPEILHQVFETLPPESLLEMHGMPEMQGQVEDFLRHAATSGSFEDAMGRTMTEAGIVDGEFRAEQVLNDWIAGELGTRAFPPENLAADTQLAMERFENVFSVMPGNANFQRQMARTYAELAEGNTINALELRQDLHNYVRQLVAEGRLADAEGDRVPPGTPAPDALDLWIAGTLRWHAEPLQ